MNRLVMWTAIVAVGLAIFGWVFRATFYWMIPVSPGEPAGLADMLDLAIFFGVLLLASLAMVGGVLLLMVPAWRNLRLAISVLVTSLVTPPLYYIVHALIPRLVH
ncbi:MAG: hypothetical protein P8Z75_04605 [Gammaproteobacteria bacterium]